MEDKDVHAIIVGLKDSIEVAVRESVYEQTKHKDAEISALHREIRKTLVDQNAAMLEQSKSIERLTLLIQDHDAFIKMVQRIIESSGYLRKFILWVLVFVPSVAGFFIGLKYLYQFTFDK